MRPGRALDRGEERATAGPRRHRISPDVWPHLARAVSWRPILAAGALAVAVVAALGRDGLPTLVPATVAAGVAYVFDDSAAVVLGSSPTSLARRRAHRLALALPMASAAWVGVYLAWSSRAQRGVAAAWPATLAFAALVALVLAAAAMGAGRGGTGRGGVAAVPILLAVVVTGRAVPPELALFVGRGYERNWAVVLAVSLAVLVVASRDPAARRPRRGVLR